MQVLYWNIGRVPSHCFCTQVLGSKHQHLFLHEPDQILDIRGASTTTSRPRTTHPHGVVTTRPLGAGGGEVCGEVCVPASLCKDLCLALSFKLMVAEVVSTTASSGLTSILTFLLTSPASAIAELFDGFSAAVMVGT